MCASPGAVVEELLPQPSSRLHVRAKRISSPPNAILNTNLPHRPLRYSLLVHSSYLLLYFTLSFRQHSLCPTETGASTSPCLLPPRLRFASRPPARCLDFLMHNPSVRPFHPLTSGTPARPTCIPQGPACVSSCATDVPQSHLLQLAASSRSIARSSTI